MFAFHHEFVWTSIKWPQTVRHFKMTPNQGHFKMKHLVQAFVAKVVTGLEQKVTSEWQFTWWWTHWRAFRNDIMHFQHPRKCSQQICHFRMTVHARWTDLKAFQNGTNYAKIKGKIVSSIQSFHNATNEHTDGHFKMTFCIATIRVNGHFKMTVHVVMSPNKGILKCRNELPTKTKNAL